MDGSVYPQKDAIVASKLVVNIYCHNEKEHAMVKWGAEEWCEHVFGVKCEDHGKNHTDTSNMFFKGSIPNPTTILCTPDGKEISRKTGSMAPKEFVTMIQEAAKKVGPGIGRDEYKFINDGLAKAEEAFTGNKVKDGIKACNDVIKAFGKNPACKTMIEKVEKKLETANQFGVEEIARAKQLSDGGDVEGARKVLKQIYADYKGLACAKEAETALAALPKDK